MQKPTRKQVAIMSLVVDKQLNIRWPNNYDIDTMRAQIKEMGGIQKDIVVYQRPRAGAEKEHDLVVLQGNRRTLAGQMLFQDGTIPADLKTALSRVHVQVYENLSEREITALVLDHGSEKPISKSEIVNAVYRLFKQGYRDGEICLMLYYALASYTGETQKLNELPEVPDSGTAKERVDAQDKREKAIKKWLHGTVGNWILAAAKMTSYVWTQFVLTHKAKEKLLGPDEVLEVKISRDRLKQLSQAKTADKEVWSPENGGPTFNALLEKFKAEDRNEVPKEAAQKRLTTKELNERADAFKDPGIRLALKLAAGEKADGLLEAEEINYRNRQVMSILAKHADRAKDKDLKALLNAVVALKVEELDKYLAVVVA